MTTNEKLNEFIDVMIHHHKSMSERYLKVGMDYLAIVEQNTLSNLEELKKIIQTEQDLESTND